MTKSFYQLYCIACTAIVLLIAQSAFAQIQTTLPLVQMDQSYTVASHSDFILQGQTFSPDNTIYVHWDFDNSTFSVYGVATTSFDGGDVRVSFGSQAQPALNLDTDTTTNAIALQVLDTFSLKELDFIAIDDETDFRYDLEDARFEISGDAFMRTGGENYAVDLGSDSSPGIIYANAALTQVVANINDSLDMHGLAANDPNLVLKWYPGNPANTYYGHGSVLIFIQGGFFYASVGSNSAPGFSIVDGQIHDVEMTVAGGALLFGALPTYDVFRLTYSQEHAEYRIQGNIVFGIPFGSLLHVPTLQMNAGEGSNGGIVYKTDSHELRVDSATFALKDARGVSAVVLGGFRLQDISISIYENVPVDIRGRVLFPAGFSIGADIGFTYDPGSSLPFFIHNFALDYEATTMAQAIPMGETGFSIVKIAGEITNLDKPAQLTFNDTLGLVFGEVITIKLPVLGTQTVYPAYFQATASVSAHELIMSVSGDLGARIASSGEWQQLLGSAVVELDLEWGKKYSMTGTLKIPSDPLVIADAEVVLSSSGDFDLLAKMQLIVPHYIPIIGGKHFGEIDGAMRMRHNDSNGSFAAGWTKLNLLFDHINIGAQYNIGNGDIRKIGAGQEHEITQMIENDPIDPPPGDPPPDYWRCKLHHDFYVGSYRPPAYLQSHLRFLNTSMFIDPDPDDNDDNIYVDVNVQGPDIDYPNLKAHRPTDTLNIFPPSDNVEILSGHKLQMKINHIDTLAWVAANHAADVYGVLDWQDQPGVLFTPGNYTMTIAGWCPLDNNIIEEDIQFTTSNSYPRPTVTLEYFPFWNVQVEYTSYISDSTIISIFWSRDTTHNGELLQSFSSMGYQSGFTSYFIQDQLHFMTQDTFYVYASITDGVSPVQYSDFVPIDATNFGEVSGTVTMSDGTPLANVPMTIYRKNFPTRRVVQLTDENGFYRFNNCRPDTLIIEALAPDSLFFSSMVSVDNEFVLRELKTVDWIQVTVHLSGTEVIHADFELTDQQTAIYGAVYDSNDVSIPGATVIIETTPGSFATQITTETGFAFLNIPEGDHSLTIILPANEEGYHWPTHQIHTTGDIKTRSDSISYLGTPVRKDYYVGHSNAPFFYFRDASTYLPLAGGQVVLTGGDPPVTLHSIVSEENGFVSIDEGDLVVGTEYQVVIAPPEGYVCAPGSCPSSITYDGTIQQLMILNFVEQ